MNKVFVLGNGESRKGLDLDVLRTHGKIYGCNAIYRDYPVDALVCVDGGIMHEVYSSGYALENQCYFRSWTRLPEFIYPDMVNLEQAMSWPKGAYSENERGNRTQFVLNGTDPNQIQRYYEHILEKYDVNDEKEKEEIHQLMIKQHMWVTWVEDEDKVSTIPDGIEGWSAGPIAVNLACLMEDPTDVYLIGFDLGSNDGTVNNVYKGTDNYVSSDSPVTFAGNWIQQHMKNFEWFPNVNFWKVNPKPIGEDEQSRYVKEWDAYDNLKYMEIKSLDF